MDFNGTVISKYWANLVREEKYTIDEVPNLFNLQEVVVKLLEKSRAES